MSYNLFLDDNRTPEDVYGKPGEIEYPSDEPHPWNGLEWITVRNYTEFRQVLKEKGIPDRVSFDYVLAIDPNWTGEKTGADCAEILESWARGYKGEYQVHSSYPGAHVEIAKALRQMK